MTARFESVTNGRNYKTSYIYDKIFRLTKVTPPIGNPIIYNYPVITGSYPYPGELPSQPATFNYNSYFNTYMKETRGANYTYTYFDGLSRETGTLDLIGSTATTVYKSCGIKDYTDSSSGDKIIFDNFGRTKEVVHKDNKKISYDYDLSNVTVTDEENHVTKYFYTAFGNPDEKLLVKVQDAELNDTSYKYTVVGKLREINQGELTRAFQYDGTLLTSETHPELGTISYERYPNGNLKTKTDGKGTKVYIYDELNRLKEIAHKDGNIGFKYDKADNVVSLISPSASMVYTYDTANRLTDRSVKIDWKTYETKYGYDGNDNLIDIDYPSGRHVDYDYNGKDQVTKVYGFGGEISTITYYTDTSKPYLGLIKEYTNPNSLKSFFSYTQRNSPFTYTVGTDVLNLEYDYWSRGNVHNIYDHLDSQNDKVFGYDTLNRLETFTGPWGSGQYGFDRYGNRTSKDMNGQIESYTYQDKATYNQLTDVGANKFFTYNSDGDVTGITEGAFSYGLSYDNLNNMTLFDAGDGSLLASFRYDGKGQRISKTSTLHDKMVIYHYDENGNILSESDYDGNFTADYVYLGGKMVAKVVSGEDSDGDGYADQFDTFPNDPAEWVDTDGDGYGDNADAFINDPTEWTDADGDGYGDNLADAFPTNPNEWIDTDGDGVGDNSDPYPTDPTLYLESVLASGTYQTQFDIVARNNCTVEAGSNVTVISGATITLSPNFHAKAGSVFTAMVQ